jgi:hypothetical protein
MDVRGGGGRGVAEHVQRANILCTLWPKSEAPVIEPLLKSAIGVRIDRGRYVTTVCFDFLALERLFARRPGACLVLDLPER